MREQLQRIGFALDWSRELATCEPDYYGHEQALFLDLMEAGLVTRKESEVNWDPVDMTVLANEQVIDGKGWRSGAPVERKKLSQWFLKITDFAEELLDGLGGARPVARQGPADAGELDRQEPGPAILLPPAPALRPAAHCDIEVFTTRPDTIFGASFVAISPGHPIAEALAAERPEVAEFIARAQAGGTSAAEIETAEKLGFDTGLEVDPPVRRQLAAAGVDRQFRADGLWHRRALRRARRMTSATLNSRPNISCRSAAWSPPTATEPSAPVTEPETDPGVAVNSQFLDGMTTDQANGRSDQAAPRPPAGARARPSIACATGAFRASAIGARRSR